MRRGGIVLLFALPVAVLLVGRVAAHRATTPAGDAARADLEAKAEDATARFRELVVAVESAARRSLASGPGDAAATLPPKLRAGFEGAGIVRAGSYESWDGTPLEPSLAPGGPGASWGIVTRGVRTSLVARSEGAPDGRHAIASLAVLVASGGPSSSPALPALCRGATMRWQFPAAHAGAARETFDAGPPARLAVPILDPRGGVAAVVTLEHVGASHVAARRRARADAAAAALFAALVAAMLASRPGGIDGRRMLAIAAGVIAARGALAFGRTFEELLPRPLGSPSVYGRDDAWGLLASPMALVATALAGFLLARALARFTSRRVALAPAAAAALAAAAGLGGSLARDARIPTPRIDLESAPALALVLALGLVIAAAAELLGALARPRFRTAWTVVAIVPVAAIAVLALHRDAERVADERLRTAYAPLVLEQSARRRQALASAVREAAEASRRAEASDPAFALWKGTDLFLQGFASSLDLVDAAGDRISHFGFGLPELTGPRERVAHPLDAAGSPTVVDEWVSFGASTERVLHADAPAARPDGGRVVGHVLEDPANLPFLPGSAPYLRALGRGGTTASGGLTDEPDYVLYADDGHVVLSTLHQPPAPSPALRAAGRSRTAMKLDAGGAGYRALPLADGERLHVLLAPARGLLDVLGDGVRLLLVAGAVVLAAGGLAALSAPGGARRILDLVRASFYRKLLTAVIFASLVPLVGIALLLRGAIERHGASELADSAAAVIAAAQRVVADYQSTGDDDPAAAPLPLTDDVLVWLRRVVGQEIHLYEGGVLAATSKPEMFDSALRLPRLPGEIDRRIVREGRPFVVRHEAIGAVMLPVAYARAALTVGPKDAVLAIPLVLEQRTFARSVERLIELLLLGTTALAGLLAVSAALLARQVAGPVRRLADASRRIAGGDYTPRLASTSRDEMGSLVADFNSMAGALAEQRADLIRRRDYIEAVLRHATTGVVSVDAADRVVTINPAAEALLAEGGRAPALGDVLPDVLARSERFRPLAAALATHPDDSVSAPIDVDMGGGPDRRRVRVVRAPLPDPAGGPLGSLLLLDDVTSLMRGNQLEAWAEMARSIAHEIKNPLTPIQLSAEHVRRLLADRGVLPAPEIDACLDAIVRQVRDLRDISQAFSTYARLPDLALEPADPAAFLREVTAPYASAPPPGVAIREDHDGAPLVSIDRRVLARAVVNLIANAVEAMPRGGTLTVTSRRDSGRGGALLSVTDTGEGISAEARARLFEPYFSTKSSGTGLGLAIVRRVVEAHGGTIDVVSARGTGTTFTIHLPEAPPR